MENSQIGPGLTAVKSFTAAVLLGPTVVTVSELFPGVSFCPVHSS